MAEQVYLSTKEIARLLGQSVETIRHWVHSYSMPCYKINSRVFKFGFYQVEEWMKNRNYLTWNNERREL